MTFLFFWGLLYHICKDPPRGTPQFPGLSGDRLRERRGALEQRISWPAGAGKSRGLLQNPPFSSILFFI